ncbi:MAG: AMP-binding protein [Acidimicrobiales bacterium]|nr:AMP-binding protein [Acidimicrobiales bacterium]RZV46114.1 MAG: 4-coumarate--CoA ligase family protein [Acidimicrobiales bacterium]
MSIYRSALPEVEIPKGISITDFTFRMADELADKPAIIDGPTGRTQTYGELLQGVQLVAGGLAARGFGPGKTLGLMAPNIPEYATFFHAAALAGGTVTTINPTYTAGEVKHQLLDSGSTILVTISMFLDIAREAAIDTAVEEIFSIDPVDGVPSLFDLLGDPPLTEQVPVDTDNMPVVLPYSSGTTGRSKGVILSHDNLTANIEQCKHVLSYRSDDVALAILPFFHIYGMQVLMNGLLANGTTIVTMPRFDLEQALNIVQEHKVTWFFAVPPIVLALAKHPLVDQYDLSTINVVFSGAAPLSAELGEEAANRLGCAVVQGYGMTELSPVSHATVVGDERPGSSGVTVSNTECRIVDPEGNDLGIDEDGELWIRGPQVMKGYLNNQEATDNTIDSDGWLHTGDVAHFDSDGHIYVVDRIKELIKYKGFQVPPAELEGLLLTHPAIADAAVIGIPDDEAGEIPKAFITAAPGAELTAEQVQQFVADQVSTYKQVRIVEFIDEIPKSASGKILRRELRDR